MRPPTKPPQPRRNGTIEFPHASSPSRRLPWMLVRIRAAAAGAPTAGRSGARTRCQPYRGRAALRAQPHRKNEYGGRREPSKRKRSVQPGGQQRPEGNEHPPGRHRHHRQGHSPRARLLQRRIRQPAFARAARSRSPQRISWRSLGDPPEQHSERAIVFPGRRRQARARERLRLPRGHGPLARRGLVSRGRPEEGGRQREWQCACAQGRRTHSARHGPGHPRHRRAISWRPTRRRFPIAPTSIRVC